MQPFREAARNMDMETGKTDKLAAAIKALPYRSPSAGFKARVMAAVAAEAAARERLAWAVKGLGALTAAWAGLVGLLSAGPLFNFAADYAPLALEPGGLALAGRLLAARAALLAGKAAALVSFARGLAETAQAHLPAAHEIFIAALLGAGLIRLAVRRPAAQKI